jgi:hypothetical protein
MVTCANAKLAPELPSSLHTPLPCFSLTLVFGTSSGVPERTWLNEVWVCVWLPSCRRRARDNLFDNFFLWKSDVGRRLVCVGWRECARVLLGEIHIYDIIYHDLHVIDMIVDLPSLFRLRAVVNAPSTCSCGMARADTERGNMRRVSRYQIRLCCLSMTCAAAASLALSHA